MSCVSKFDTKKTISNNCFRTTSNTKYNQLPFGPHCFNSKHINWITLILFTKHIRLYLKRCDSDLHYRGKKITLIKKTATCENPQTFAINQPLDSDMILIAPYILLSGSSFDNVYVCWLVGWSVRGDCDSSSR